MARPKREFPEDFGSGDYVLMDITVDKYPKIQFELDGKTGEVLPSLKPKPKKIERIIPILIDPNGMNVITVNLFIRSLLYKGKVLKKKTLDSYASALLNFYRWLAWEHEGDEEAGIPPKEPMTIYDVTSEPENGVVYLYRDHLLRNVLTEDENGDITGIYTPSTASNYVQRLVAYYDFLRVERIVRFSKEFIPYVYSTRKIPKKQKAKMLDHNMLGHLQKGNNDIYINTTGLTNPFGKVQSVESHHKLSPLRDDEKYVFYEYLNIDESNDVKGLMLYLKAEAGLRVEELVTFPESEVRKPHGDVEAVTISEIRNGCMTKFDKERTIEVPAEVMERLYQYKLSKERKDSISKSLLRHQCLFVKSDGLNYATNTIQKHVEEIRNNIRLTYPEMYFTPHDLRATFATNWMYNEHMKTGRLFDVMIDDLAKIMGHDDTATTQKYIRYMNDDKYWIEFSERKNAFAKHAMEAGE